MTFSGPGLLDVVRIRMQKPGLLWASQQFPTSVEHDLRGMDAFTQRPALMGL